MQRLAASTLLACALAAPAWAIEENEDLVMQIVFDECLGYMRDGRAPFQTLDTAPPTESADEMLGILLGGREDAVQLLSPRYVADWGQDEAARYCRVSTVWDGDALAGEAVLGVDPHGFIERVTKRAFAAGLTVSYPDMEFSPIHTTYWSEPETGFLDGPMRPITLTIMPTDANEDESLLDAGLIIMGGPTMPQDDAQ